MNKTSRNNISRKNILSKSISRKTISRKYHEGGNLFDRKFENFDSEFEYLLERMRDNDPKLKSVDLKHMAFWHGHGHGALSGGRGHGNAYYQFESKIANSIIKSFSEALKVNNTIERLTATFLGFNDEGAEALAEALKENKSLNDIFISHNRIGDEGAEALAEALKNNVTIDELDMEFNDIGDEGAKALAGALEVNKELMFLRLSKNKIGDEGVKAFTRALKTNKTLMGLQMFFNNITDIGGQRLLEFFMNDSKESRAISIYDKNISRKLLKKIDAIRNYNRERNIISKNIISKKKTTLTKSNVNMNNRTEFLYHRAKKYKTKSDKNIANMHIKHPFNNINNENL